MCARGRKPPGRRCGKAIEASADLRPDQAIKRTRGRVQDRAGEGARRTVPPFRARWLTRMFNAAEAAFGGVDVLVNNGGIMKLSTIAEADDDSFDRQIAINLKGVFNGMREAARRLRSGGRIVSFSSSVVCLYQPTYGIYAATKAGVEAMTHILSKELHGRDITVNAVAPGPVATRLFLDGKPKEAVEGAAKASPLGRLGEPDDIARTVSFLVGPDGGWINGQVLRANGGII